MIMRYYWGLGVGHVYSHGDTKTGTNRNEEGGEDSDVEKAAISKPCRSEAPRQIIDTTCRDDDHNEDNSEDGNLDVVDELGLEDRENDMWADTDSDEGCESGFIDDDFSGGEEELELEYTYNRYY